MLKITDKYYRMIRLNPKKYNSYIFRTEQKNGNYYYNNDGVFNPYYYDDNRLFVAMSVYNDGEIIEYRYNR